MHGDRRIGSANLWHVKRALPILAVVVVVAAVVVGLVQAGGGDGGSGRESSGQGGGAHQLAGAPAPLKALHDQSGELIGGGPDAFRKRLAELRGYPVVVNKWASWCGPCRAEFPFFEKAAREHGKRVAFLGVNSNDNDAAAREFLGKFDLSYPSYTDPKLKVAEVFNAVAAFPSTAFYDAKGKLRFVRQGGYSSEQKLLEDIRRYTG